MEPCGCKESRETLTELQRARLDRIAERIKAGDPDRGAALMDKIETEADMEERQVFSLEDAAKLFDCHKETLRRAIRAGKLKAGKIGKDYRISRADLEAYYRERGGGMLFSEGDE